MERGVRLFQEVLIPFFLLQKSPSLSGIFPIILRFSGADNAPYPRVCLIFGGESRYPIAGILYVLDRGYAVRNGGHKQGLVFQLLGTSRANVDSLLFASGATLLGYFFFSKRIGPLPLRKAHPHSILRVPTTQLAKMSIDPKFVQLTAGVLKLFLQNFVSRHDACCDGGSTLWEGKKKR